MRNLILIAVLSLSAWGQCGPGQVLAPVGGGRVSCKNTSSVAVKDPNGNLTVTSTVLVPIANEGSTGTTLNKLAKLTGAPSTAIITATTDVNGAVGIVQSGAGTTGSAGVARFGLATCAFDGATTAGDYVQISATVAGDCHDAGSGYPTSGQVIGFVMSTNVGAGAYSVLIRPDIVSSAPAVTISGSCPVTVSSLGFYYNNTAGACTFTLPAITAGMVLPPVARYCFGNAVTRTGAVTLQLPSSTYMISAGAVGSAAGTFVSGGALGDATCIVAVDTTHYQAYVGSGSWTNN